MIFLLGLFLFQQPCTITRDANNNVIVGPNCTAADIFVNVNTNDYRLTNVSPAIGNAVCLPEVTTDISGAPRPGRAPNARFPGDTGCDIGAYQFLEPNPPPTPPTNLRILQP